MRWLHSTSFARSHTPDSWSRVTEFSLPPSARRAYDDLPKAPYRRAFSNINLADSSSASEDGYDERPRSSGVSKYHRHHLDISNREDNSYDSSSRDSSIHSYRRLPRLLPMEIVLERAEIRLRPTSLLEDESHRLLLVNDQGQWDKQEPKSDVNTPSLSTDPMDFKVIYLKNPISPPKICEEIGFVTPTMERTTQIERDFGQPISMAIIPAQSQMLEEKRISYVNEFQTSEIVQKQSEAKIIIVNSSQPVIEQTRDVVLSSQPEQITNGEKQVQPRLVSISAESVLMKPYIHVQRIITKPPNLRRDIFTLDYSEKRRSVTRSESVSKEYFVSNNMNAMDAPETKYVALYDGFGCLEDYIGHIILRLHDSAVIPGGALRGIVYIRVKKPIVLSELVVNVESTLKSKSTHEKHDMERHFHVPWIVLTQNTTIPRREPPHKLTYQLPEFSQSALKVADLNNSCYVPYYGPVQFNQGEYGIPFAFPLDQTSHPSIMIRGRVGLASELEVRFWYSVSASLKVYTAEIPREIELQTGSLNFKVLSCGPTNRRLPNGDLLPAISQQFQMNGRTMLIQLESVVLQDAEDINIYLFTDNPSGIRFARAVLLRIFHVPELKVFDEKALYKLKRYPPNVYVDADTGKVQFVPDMESPFSEAAERLMRRSQSQTDDLPVQYRNFRVSMASAYDDADSNINEFQRNSLVPELPHESRRVGCHLTLTVPPNSAPQSCLESSRITYYIRVLIYEKRKVLAYSLPISVVETRVRDYNMRYLGDGHYLYDPEYLKLKKNSRCNIS